MHVPCNDERACPLDEIAAGCGVSVYIPGPAPTPAAAPLSAAAQSEESFGFLPFVARIAFPAACLRAFLAFFSSFAAFFVGLVAACSMKLTARSNLFVTLAGTVSLAQAGLVRPMSRTHRALVQGKVVVVVVVVEDV